VKVQACISFKEEETFSELLKTLIQQTRLPKTALKNVRKPNLFFLSKGFPEGLSFLKLTKFKGLQLFVIIAQLSDHCYIWHGKEWRRD